MSLITETARYRINRSIHGKVAVTVKGRRSEYVGSHRTGISEGSIVRIADVNSVPASLVGKIGTVRHHDRLGYWISGIGTVLAGPYQTDEFELV